MKKTYNAPLLEVLQLNSQKGFLEGLLAASNSLETFSEEEYEW